MGQILRLCKDSYEKKNEINKTIVLKKDVDRHQRKEKYAA